MGLQIHNRLDQTARDEDITPLRNETEILVPVRHVVELRNEVTQKDPGLISVLGPDGKTGL